MSIRLLCCSHYISLQRDVFLQPRCARIHVDTPMLVNIESRLCATTLKIVLFKISNDGGECVYAEWNLSVSVAVSPPTETPGVEAESVEHRYLSIYSQVIGIIRIGQ